MSGGNVVTAIVPIRAPSASDPALPRQMGARGVLDHIKPRVAPITDPQRTASSPVPGMYWMLTYLARKELPERYEMKPTLSAITITSTIASPSNRPVILERPGFATF